VSTAKPSRAGERFSAVELAALKRSLGALLVCVAVAACKHGGAAGRDAGATFRPSPRPKTQSPAISISNLDGEIDDARRRAGEGQVFFRDRLPEKLVERASYLGTTKDYDEADRVSAKSVELDPNDVAALMTRAHVLSALHEFGAALGVLDRAAAHGAPADDARRARASVFLATGRCVEAAALWPALPYPTDMAARGAIEQRLGHPELAETLFERGRVEFRDVSPMRLAWMDFERARAFEREGDREKARAYLEDALAAFPEYAHAAVHAAALEPPARALALLAVVEKRAEDPDVLAAHADALRRAGRDAEARAMTTDRARAGFEELLRTHQAAFADHAARFFLGEGGDVARALALAKTAAANAPSEETLELWLLAARAARSTAEACAAVAAAGKTTCPLRGSRPEFDLARRACKP
jgi:tetratricopeptide (TPR) repeat protein